MSYRAIQRLREERESALQRDHESDSEDDEDEDFHGNEGGKTSFAAMMDSDSESSSDENEGEDDNDHDGVEGACEEVEDVYSDVKRSTKTEGARKSTAYDDENPLNLLGNQKADTFVSKDEDKTVGELRDPAEPAVNIASDIAEEKIKDDFDALIEEFKIQDESSGDAPSLLESAEAACFDIIMTSMDLRDLDYDYVMRTSLLGSGSGDSASRGGRRARQKFLFGSPRDDWIRPPRYVGGGIGMTTYDNDSRPLPWPYCGMKEGDKSNKLDRWFTFIHSESYSRDCAGYQRIKASGDPNALALFVAHHPYVTEALLQLALVLYQTNQFHEGLTVLRRALWIYECSSLTSFMKDDRKACFMDYDQPENALFFSSLFRLVRASYVAGLARTSLASSRYILSLDPLRDPMGVLLALDHFSLLTNSESNDKWLVQFVESQKVRVHYRDESTQKEYECDLLELPNWAYSYALAIHRMSRKEDSSVDSKMESRNAIQSALRRFPSVVELLLHENGVDVTARSFRMDWPSVLDYISNRAAELQNSWPSSSSNDPIVRSCTVQAYKLIVQIFVKQNFKLWGEEGVLCWVYENLQDLKASNSSEPTIPLSPALMRYLRFDASEYDAKFQTMPPDANPFDPGLVAHALAMDPNRRRFLQRMPHGGGARGVEEENDVAVGRDNLMLGPPSQTIDPDWPLLEVFWRSALPWNHVEGMPPPRR